MFRKITAVTTALALSIMLTACGGEEGPTGAEPPGARAAPAQAGAETNAQTRGQPGVPVPTRPQRLEFRPTEEPSETPETGRATVPKGTPETGGTPETRRAAVPGGTPETGRAAVPGRNARDRGKATGNPEGNYRHSHPRTARTARARKAQAAGRRRPCPETCPRRT